MTSDRLLIAALESSLALIAAWGISFLPIRAQWRIWVIRLAFVRLALSLVPTAAFIVAIPATSRQNDGSVAGLAIWGVGVALCGLAILVEWRLMHSVLRSASPVESGLIGELSGVMRVKR